MTDGDGNDGAGPDHSLIRKIDAMGWGAFFIWIGVALIADVGWGTGLLGVSAISLGVQAIRRRLALPVDAWGAAVGGCLFAAGLLQVLESSSGRIVLAAWALPAAFICTGVYIMHATWTRKTI